MIKLALPTAAILALVFSSATAFADPTNPPLPPCWDNPFCGSGSCSFSGHPAGATGLAGVLIAGAAVLAVRRRRSHA